MAAAAAALFALGSASTTLAAESAVYLDIPKGELSRLTKSLNLTDKQRKDIWMILQKSDIEVRSKIKERDLRIRAVLGEDQQKMFDDLGSASPAASEDPGLRERRRSRRDPRRSLSDSDDRRRFREEGWDMPDPRGMDDPRDPRHRFHPSMPHPGQSGGQDFVLPPREMAEDMGEEGDPRGMMDDMGRGRPDPRERMGGPGGRRPDPRAVRRMMRRIKRLCGDGVCQRPERDLGACPKDCGARRSGR